MLRVQQFSCSSHHYHFFQQTYNKLFGDTGHKLRRKAKNDAEIHHRRYKN